MNIHFYYSVYIVKCFNTLVLSVSIIVYIEKERNIQLTLSTLKASLPITHKELASENVSHRNKMKML
jgi:hypothetical protein